MSDPDATTYLTASPANAERLTEAVERLEAGAGEIHDLDKDEPLATGGVITNPPRLNEGGCVFPAARPTVPDPREVIGTVNPAHGAAVKQAADAFAKAITKNLRRAPGGCEDEETA